MGTLKLQEPKGDNLLGDKFRLMLQEVTPEEQAATVEEVVEEVDEIGALIAELRAAYGMGEDAMPTDVLAAAIEKANGGGDEEAETEEQTEKDGDDIKALKDVLGVDRKAGIKTMVTKATELVLGTVTREEHAKTALQLKELTDEKQARDSQTLVDKYVKAGVLNPHDDTRMKVALTQARDNREAFIALMDVATPVMPADGQVTADGDGSGKTSRERVILKAAKAYDADVALGATQAGWVNGALDTEGMSPLTDTETKTLTA